MSCSDKRPDRICAGDGRDPVPEQIAPERHELRWIDPDYWGRLAWAWLFAAGTTVRGGRRLMIWRRMIGLLPRILPCFSCRHCCDGYLQKHPVGDDAREVLPWLARLRLNVRDRNRRDGDVTPAQVRLQDQNRPETEDGAVRRFVRRLAFPLLWYGDVWLFMGAVFLVADWASADNRAAVHQFLHCMWALTPRPFGWPCPAAPMADLAAALDWLAHGARVHRQANAWLTLLSMLPVQSRTVCKKKPTSTKSKPDPPPQI